MIDASNYRFRKPVGFSEYHVLLVKVEGIWCIDTGTWDHEEAKRLLSHERKMSGTTKTMLVTSPSDDERVVARIVAACNHQGRKH